MPTISRFYGLIIRMNLRSREHNPPHIHAEYGEYEALIDLRDLSVVRGKLPNRALEMTLEWTSHNQQKLLEMWETSQITKLPPLV